MYNRFATNNATINFAAKLINYCVILWLAMAIKISTVYYCILLRWKNSIYVCQMELVIFVLAYLSVRSVLAGTRRVPWKENIAFLNIIPQLLMLFNNKPINNKLL